MQRAFFTAALLFALVVAGCATKLPPIDPTYDSTSTIVSEAIVRITHSSGAIEGSISQPSRVIPVAGAYISVPAGAAFDARFGAADQEETARLLGSELTRIRTIRGVSEPASSTAADATIHLAFDRTQLVRQNLFYIIDVTLTISGNSKYLTKQYHIDVHEECSTEERWHSTYSRNKIKAKKIILARLVPDVEEFLKTANIKTSNQPLQRTASGAR